MTRVLFAATLFFSLLAGWDVDRSQAQMPIGQIELPTITPSTPPAIQPAIQSTAQSASTPKGDSLPRWSFRHMPIFRPISQRISRSNSSQPFTSNALPTHPLSSNPLPTVSLPEIELTSVSLSSASFESEAGHFDYVPVVTSSSSVWQWHIRPTGFVYHTYWASAQEPRLSTQLVSDSGSGSLLDSTIGGRLGIVRFGPRDRPAGFQLDLLAKASLRQDADKRLDMVGTDYRFDIPLTYGIGNHRFKFGYYHISSHTGDEFLAKNPDHVRLNFFRDVLVFGYSNYVTPKLRLYGEAGYAFGSEFSEPWEFQFGMDYGPSGPTGYRGEPFFAINGHLREELNFGGNLALQAGWAWRGELPGDGTFRTGFYYYNGGSPQFSFYQENEQQTGWGLWYDF